MVCQPQGQGGLPGASNNQIANTDDVGRESPPALPRLLLVVVQTRFVEGDAKTEHLVQRPWWR